MNNPIRLVTNLSVMFTEHPMLERPAQAKDAGFDEVETWWPFGGEPTPSSTQVADFVASIADAHVTLTAMNLYGGHPGERGVLSHPDRSEEFRASVDVAMAIAAQLGTRLFNAPYGNRRAEYSPADMDATATANLAYAARAAARLGGRVLIEPLSDASGTQPEFPVLSVHDALAVIERVRAEPGSPALGLLFDQYHLATNGFDVLAEARDNVDVIDHVQLADVPGRGEPGSGTADIGAVIKTLRALGYEGAFSLEYLPTTGSTLDSLDAFGSDLARWHLEAH